jgi:hypothetical protein
MVITDLWLPEQIGFIEPRPAEQVCPEISSGNVFIVVS